MGSDHSFDYTIDRLERTKEVVLFVAKPRLILSYPSTWQPVSYENAHLRMISNVNMLT